MSVTYTAALPVREETVLFLSGLLHTERRRLGTRTGTRSLGCYRQAILVLRWLRDGTRITQLAVDNALSRSTGYAYLHEGIRVLAAHAPSLHSVLLAAKMAGCAHVTIDGTLIETDRCRIPGPTPGVDLWWSGKHDNHGGNIQVITAPDGWPLWTSPVRPGREHDTTAVREHAEILPLFTAWTDDDLRVLCDLGYEGEQATITVAYKKPKNAGWTDVQQQFNRAHNAVRAIGDGETHCSRPRSKPCATSASAPGASAGSPQQHSRSCTSSTAVPPDRNPLLNVNGRYSERLSAQFCDVPPAGARTNLRRVVRLTRRVSTA